MQVAFYGFIIGQPPQDEAAFIALAQEWSPGLLGNLAEIDAAVKNALDAPLPDTDEIYKDVLEETA